MAAACQVASPAAADFGEQWRQRTLLIVWQGSGPGPGRLGQGATVARQMTASKRKWVTGAVDEATRLCELACDVVSLLRSSECTSRVLGAEPVL